MADFGAEIIKVEAPECGSPTRAMAPIVAGGSDGSGLFAYLNTNKRSVVLDLGSDDGLETAHQLIGTADAVIDDRAFNWATDRSSRHPDVVWCSISPFGQDAPAEYGNAKSINVFHASGWGTTRPATLTPPSRRCRGLAGSCPTTKRGWKPRSA